MMLAYLLNTDCRNRRVVEGGDHRTFEIYHYIDQNILNAKLLSIHKENDTLGLLQRVMRVSNILLQLARPNIHILLVNYPTFPFAFKQTNYNLLKGLFFLLFIQYLRFIKGLYLVINANDFPLEQSEALSYSILADLRLVRIFEKYLLRLASEIWFVSQGMNDYITETRCIIGKVKKVVINGNIRQGTSVKNTGLSSPQIEIRFVYAGTLWRGGRGVEDLLNAFKAVPDPQVRLYLCGIDGDWIIKECHDPRISYLGAMRAEECNAFVSQCDVGIVPYPDSFYCNTTFPTKLSLYITCKVPIILVNCKGVKDIVQRNQIGICCETSGLKEAVQYMADNPDMRVLYRDNISRIKDDFFWDKIFAGAFSDLPGLKVQE